MVCATVLSGCAHPKLRQTPITVVSERPDASKRSDVARKRHTSLAEYVPYFKDPAFEEAAQALDEDRLSAALPLFEEIVQNTSDTVITPRANFLVGYIAERIGDDERALPILKQSARDLPLIADLALERAARAALRLGRCEEAVSLANRVSETSTYAADAALTKADALRFLGRHEAGIAAYQAYLGRWPSGYRHQEAKSRIVSAAGALSKAGKLSEEHAELAFEMLMALQASSPQGYWTRQANDHESALRLRLKKPDSKEPPIGRAAIKAYETAKELKLKMRNESAEKEYARVIKLARNNPRLRCLARLEQAIVVQQQRDFERAAGLYDAVARECDDPNVRIRSLYRGAKAYDASGDEQNAIRLFAAVERDFAEHSYADDARLRGARVELALGNRDRFEEMLSTLPDLYPDGDMRAEALWTLCHDAIVRGELTSAKEHLLKYFNLFPNETGWYVAGRSGYWLARVNERLGDQISARAYYEQVIASAPLSFYMVLAYNRLADMDAARARNLIETLAPGGEALDLRFQQAYIYDHPGLASGIELHRLGLVSCAKREFDAMLEKPDLPAEVYWIVAAFQRRLGAYSDAKETTSKDMSWTRRYPANRDLMPWTLAYPSVFEEVVESAASKSNVSPFLIWAIMREESGFNTKIESWANAMGLMQLILPTAKSMGKQLGINVNRRLLRKPEVNIPLGAAYLDYLNNKFGGHPVLTVAGYNAGEGAVGRWLKDNIKDIDLFVEEIPYEQTRGYTKRVVSSLATYMFLYDDKRRILSLPLRLP